MKIVPFGDVSRQAWNDVAVQSDYAWMMHRAEWVDIETRFFEGQNLSFAVSEKDAVIAIQPLYLASTLQTGGAEQLIHSGIHRHAGLAQIPGLDEKTAHWVERAAMAEIFRQAERLDADRIQLGVHSLAPICFTTARPEVPFWVSEDGFQLGLNFAETGSLALPGFVTCCADQIANLSEPVEILFGRIDRTAVRKAERCGLEFRVSHNPSDLEMYLNLARRSATRTGERLPDSDYYRTIFQFFMPKHMAGISLAVWQAHPIAAVLFLADKDSLSYLAGISDPEHLDKCGNDFVHWRTMTWGKVNGFLRYRLGPSFPEVPETWPIAKVSKFKTKFGGRSYMTIQGSYYRRPEAYRERALAHVELLCRARGDSSSSEHSTQ